MVEDGKAAVKRVKPGAERGTDVVIEEGLTGGEQVIVEGLQGVRPGAPVRASPLPQATSTGAEPMLSAIFVDRPRLAIVIAIVTTIAGAAGAAAPSRSRSIPISCRRRSRSRRAIPAPSAAVVDATIAQPIEAQVVGVDKMIYMKSVQRQRRQLHADRLVRARHQSRHQHRQRQQPRAGRAVAACRRRCSARA